MIMPLLVGMYASFAIIAMSITPIVAAEETEDIPTNAQNTGYHDSLVAALSQAGLVGALQADGPFTVFAPTDQAFADAGIDLTTFDTEEENNTLVDILKYHVVVGNILSTDLTDGMTTNAFNGDELVFDLSNDNVMVNDARVTEQDILASNGVIHVIDKVLMPPADPVGDICFNSVTQTLVPGANYEVCSAYMYVVDFEMAGQTFTGCYNTQTHQLADVSQEICEAYTWIPAIDIPSTAAATTIHTSLVAALTQADLVTALQADGPFTVFAPTDQAFADAGIDLTALDTEEGKATLVDILKYHVYSGSVASTEVTDGLTVTMLNGDDATFAVSDGVVKVGDATVTLADVTASNGVIHVIDKVLMPPADLVDIPSTAAATTIHTSLVAALTQADLVTALQADGPFTVFAPTDQAFADAGIDLTALDTEEGKATLVDILKYHVYSGSVASTEVTDGLTVTMLNGDDATFAVSDGVVKVGDATVTLADVTASNGVIHVIDKVLMPPADIPEGCDYVVGIDSTGYKFDNPDLSINVGQTVCWIWNDESMGHNVAQIENEGDKERLRGGKYSGEMMETEDFRITFDEDQTFFYICEPHVSMDMVGKVTVGTGIMVESEPTTVEDETENSTPGFTAIVLAIGVISAVFVASRMDRE